MTHRRKGFMEVVAQSATKWAGTSFATILAATTVLGWLVGGLVYFGFGDTYQLVINTGTTIVTFIMVFLIQRTQNKESHAVHLKLNELLAASQAANNKLICIEDMSEADLLLMRATYRALADKAKHD